MCVCVCVHGITCCGWLSRRKVHVHAYMCVATCVGAHRSTATYVVAMALAISIFSQTVYTFAFHLFLHIQSQQLVAIDSTVFVTEFELLATC